VVRAAHNSQPRARDEDRAGPTPGRITVSYFVNDIWPVCVANAETVPTHACVHVVLIVPDIELAAAVSPPVPVIEQVGRPANAPAGTETLAVR
jgi:hypothetical protein